ncbi:hypothetical protein [Algoriphagus sp. A40]|uniref:hypothetical protein n=1 Tax=Algoriphagus sp. A40 TaxID=1945863 RepID=UPI0009843064|nr:hypothetical protein [Algoriphagus sp. A40]OOG77642.1 hypothetical protein B0E43_04400 [Algoriphagus sp. A40]
MNAILELTYWLYNYCTDFVINLANIFKLSYYEINYILFVILYPLAHLWDWPSLSCSKMEVFQIEEATNQTPLRRINPTKSALDNFWNQVESNRILKP